MPFINPGNKNIKYNWYMKAKVQAYGEYYLFKKSTIEINGTGLIQAGLYIIYPAYIKVLGPYGLKIYKIQFIML